MAHHDTLTGMPNRRLFREQLLKALNSRSADRTAAVLCLDLDNFKSVNDTLGHPYGDELLRLLAKRLPKSLREQDTLARLGGDEFAIVLPSIGQQEDVRRMAERLLETVRQPFEIDGHTVPISVSIGIALADTPDCSADHLLRYADMALRDGPAPGYHGAAAPTSLPAHHGCQPRARGGPRSPDALAASGQGPDHAQRLHPHCRRDRADP
ncbi:hypothetical protein G6F23_013783 [Rhizopus arrhizus]|nr:hypothetical protein G6F23_013783 [Rhizopus arrhizus]